MAWVEIEKAFHRALFLSFSRLPLLLTFLVLVLCGILTIFCRALSLEAGSWMRLSLGFLPLFLSSGILLALGVVLSRFYYHEMKQIPINLRRLVSSSIDLILGVSYLAVPSFLLYLLFWILLGFFFLLKEIPGIGNFFSTVLAFAPFLLIFSSLLLCLVNLALLFFVAPVANLQSMRKGALAKRVFDSLKQRWLSALALLFIGMMPLLLISGCLYLAGSLTNTHFFVLESSVSIAIESFFLMLPFTAILTPAVVFFFHFSAEATALLNQKSLLK